jgi:dihydrofolate reductase
MRKIIAITQVSLDGVMQAPGGPEEDPSGGFTLGGWAMPFMEKAAENPVEELLAREYDLLLGRRTYQIWEAYWPFQAAENPIAKGFNRATKFVVTRTLTKFAWAKSQQVGGEGNDTVAALRQLKASQGPELHLWGSGNLLQTLIAANLVDEYRLWVFPLILGRGKRLFENGVPPGQFELVESRGDPSGVLFNTYHPAGPLPKAAPLPGTPPGK